MLEVLQFPSVGCWHGVASHIDTASAVTGHTRHDAVDVNEHLNLQPRTTLGQGHESVVTYTSLTSKAR